MEKPLVADYKVIGIAASYAEVTNIDTGAGHASGEIVGGIDNGALEGEAGEPRSGGTALDIRLGEGGGVGETTVVEGVIGGDGQHLEVDIVLADIVGGEFLDGTGEGLGVLIAGIDAETTAIGVEVELVVFVTTAKASGVDGQTGGESSVAGTDAEGGAKTGAEVGMGLDAVEGAMGTDIIAGDIGADLQGETATGTGDVVGVVADLVITGLKNAVDTMANLLTTALSEGW